MFIERNPVCKVRSKELIIPVSETGALDIENDTELFQGHSKTTQKRQEQVSQIPWHCYKMGPLLGTRVPMGTFLVIWVPFGSPFHVLGPLFQF